MKKINPKLVMLAGVFGCSWSSLILRLSQAPSLVSATYRLLWTGLLLTPAVLLRHRQELREAKPRDILMCAASGVFLALHFMFWFESVKLTTIASSSVFVNTEIIFSAIGFTVLLRGRIPPLGFMAIAVAFLGGAVIAAGGAGGVGSDLLGCAYALLGAVFVSVYTLIGRVQRQRLSTSAYTYLTYLSSGLCLLILDLFTGTPLIGWGGKELLIGLALSVLCTFLGHSLFSWSLGYLNPALVSSMKLCEPVFASGMALLLFREIPGTNQMIGAVIIIGGILLFIYAEHRANQNSGGEAEQTQTL